MTDSNGPGTPGKPWRPGSGTEGDLFEAFYCERCERSRETRESEAETGEAKNPCAIQGNALGNNIDAPGYPPEWQNNDDGWGCCTAFEEQKPEGAKRGLIGGLDGRESESIEAGLKGLGYIQ